MTIIDTMKNVIDQFCEDGKHFSAYDVTKEVNKTDFVRHVNFRSFVHEEAVNRCGDWDYTRTAVNLPAAKQKVWIYHPAGVSPLVETPEAVMITELDNRNRLCIPTSIVQSLSLDIGDHVQLITVDEKQVTVVKTNAEPNHGVYTVDKDFNIRVNGNILADLIGKMKDAYEIKVEGSAIVISNHENLVDWALDTALKQLPAAPLGSPDAQTFPTMAVQI